MSRKRVLVPEQAAPGITGSAKMLTFSSSPHTSARIAAELNVSGMPSRLPITRRTHTPLVKPELIGDAIHSECSWFRGIGGGDFGGDHVSSVSGSQACREERDLVIHCDQSDSVDGGMNLGYSKAFRRQASAPANSRSFNTYTGASEGEELGKFMRRATFNAPLGAASGFITSSEFYAKRFTPVHFRANRGFGRRRSLAGFGGDMNGGGAANASDGNSTNDAEWNTFRTGLSGLRRQSEIPESSPHLWNKIPPGESGIVQQHCSMNIAEVVDAGDIRPGGPTKPAVPVPVRPLFTAKTSRRRTSSVEGVSPTLTNRSRKIITRSTSSFNRNIRGRSGGRPQSNDLVGQGTSSHEGPGGRFGRTADPLSSLSEFEVSDANNHLPSSIQRSATALTTSVSNMSSLAGVRTIPATSGTDTLGADLGFPQHEDDDVEDEDDFKTDLSLSTFTSASSMLADDDSNVALPNSETDAGPWDNYAAVDSASTRPATSNLAVVSLSKDVSGGETKTSSPTPSAETLLSPPMLLPAAATEGTPSGPPLTTLLFAAHGNATVLTGDTSVGSPFGSVSATSPVYSDNTNGPIKSPKKPSFPRFINPSKHGTPAITAGEAVIFSASPRRPVFTDPVSRLSVPSSVLVSAEDSVDLSPGAPATDCNPVQPRRASLDARGGAVASSGGTTKSSVQHAHSFWSGARRGSITAVFSNFGSSGTSTGEDSSVLHPTAHTGFTQRRSSHGLVSTGYGMARLLSALLPSPRRRASALDRHASATYAWSRDAAPGGSASPHSPCASQTSGKGLANLSTTRATLTTSSIPAPEPANAFGEPLDTALVCPPDHGTATTGTGRRNGASVAVPFCPAEAGASSSFLSRQEHPAPFRESLAATTNSADHGSASDDENSPMCPAPSIIPAATSVLITGPRNSFDNTLHNRLCQETSCRIHYPRGSPGIKTSDRLTAHSEGSHVSCTSPARLYPKAKGVHALTCLESATTPADESAKIDGSRAVNQPRYLASLCAQQIRSQPFAVTMIPSDDSAAAASTQQSGTPAGHGEGLPSVINGACGSLLHNGDILPEVTYSVDGEISDTNTFVPLPGAAGGKVTGDDGCHKRSDDWLAAGKMSPPASGNEGEDAWRTPTATTTATRRHGSIVASGICSGSAHVSRGQPVSFSPWFLDNRPELDVGAILSEGDLAIMANRVSIASSSPSASVARSGTTTGIRVECSTDGNTSLAHLSSPEVTETTSASSDKAAGVFSMSSTPNAAYSTVSAAEPDRPNINVGCYGDVVSKSVLCPRAHEGPGCVDIISSNTSAPSFAPPTRPLRNAASLGGLNSTKGQSPSAPQPRVNDPTMAPSRRLGTVSAESPSLAGGTTKSSLATAEKFSSGIAVRAIDGQRDILTPTIIARDCPLGSHRLKRSASKSTSNTSRSYPDLRSGFSLDNDPENLSPRTSVTDSRPSLTYRRKGYRRKRLGRGSSARDGRRGSTARSENAGYESNNSSEFDGRAGLWSGEKELEPLTPPSQLRCELITMLKLHNCPRESPVAGDCGVLPKELQGESTANSSGFDGAVAEDEKNDDRQTPSPHNHKNPPNTPSVASHLSEAASAPIQLGRDLIAAIPSPSVTTYDIRPVQSRSAGCPDGSPGLATYSPEALSNTLFSVQVHGAAGGATTPAVMAAAVTPVGLTLQTQQPSSKAAKTQPFSCYEDVTRPGPLAPIAEAETGSRPDSPTEEAASSSGMTRKVCVRCQGVLFQAIQANWTREQVATTAAVLDSLAAQLLKARQPLADLADSTVPHDDWLFALESLAHMFGMKAVDGSIRPLVVPGTEVVHDRIYRVPHFETIFKLGPIVGRSDQGEIRYAVPLFAAIYLTNELRVKKTKLWSRRILPSPETSPLARLERILRGATQEGDVADRQRPGSPASLASSAFDRDNLSVLKLVKILPKTVWPEKKDIIRVAKFMDDQHKITRGKTIKLLEVFVDEWNFFFLMERIEGPHLAEFMANLTSPTELDCKDAFRQILQILHSIHGQGFIHRDVRPENFLIRVDSCDSATALLSRKQKYDLRANFKIAPGHQQLSSRNDIEVTVSGTASKPVGTGDVVASDGPGASRPNVTSPTGELQRRTPWPPCPREGKAEVPHNRYRDVLLATWERSALSLGSANNSDVMDDHANGQGHGDGSAGSELASKDEAPNLVLVNYGAACERQDAPWVVPSGRMAFMAPELFLSRRCPYVHTTAIDIWAAGQILAYLCCGQCLLTSTLAALGGSALRRIPSTQIFSDSGFFLRPHHYWQIGVIDLLSLANSQHDAKDSMASPQKPGHVSDALRMKMIAHSINSRLRSGFTDSDSNSENCDVDDSSCREPKRCGSNHSERNSNVGSGFESSGDADDHHRRKRPQRGRPRVLDTPYRGSSQTSRPSAGGDSHWIGSTDEDSPSKKAKPGLSQTCPAILASVIDTGLGQRQRLPDSWKNRVDRYLTYFVPGLEEAVCQAAHHAPLEAVRLIIQMLTVDPALRCTAETALRSPWLLRRTPSSDASSDSQEALGASIPPFVQKGWQEYNDSLTAQRYGAYAASPVSCLVSTGLDRQSPLDLNFPVDIGPGFHRHYPVVETPFPSAANACTNAVPCHHQPPTLKEPTTLVDTVVGSSSLSGSSSSPGKVTRNDGAVFSEAAFMTPIPKDLNLGSAEQPLVANSQDIHLQGRQLVNPGLSDMRSLRDRPGRPPLHGGEVAEKDVYRSGVTTTLSRTSRINQAPSWAPSPAKARLLRRRATISHERLASFHNEVLAELEREPPAREALKAGRGTESQSNIRTSRLDSSPSVATPSPQRQPQALLAPGAQESPQTGSHVPRLINRSRSRRSSQILNVIGNSLKHMWGGGEHSSSLTPAIAQRRHSVAATTATKAGHSVLRSNGSGGGEDAAVVAQLAEFLDVRRKMISISHKLKAGEDVDEEAVEVILGGYESGESAAARDDSGQRSDQIVPSPDRSGSKRTPTFTADRNDDDDHDAAGEMVSRRSSFVISAPTGRRLSRADGAPAVAALCNRGGRGADGYCPTSHDLVPVLTGRRLSHADSGSPLPPPRPPYPSNHQGPLEEATSTDATPMPKSFSRSPLGLPPVPWRSGHELTRAALQPIASNAGVTVQSNDISSQENDSVPPNSRGSVPPPTSAPVSASAAHISRSLCGASGPERGTMIPEKNSEDEDSYALGTPQPQGRFEPPQVVSPVLPLTTTLGGGSTAFRPWNNNQGEGGGSRKRSEKDHLAGSPTLGHRPDSVNSPKHQVDTSQGFLQRGHWPFNAPCQLDSPSVSNGIHLSADSGSPSFAPNRQCGLPAGAQFPGTNNYSGIYYSGGNGMPSYCGSHIQPTTTSSPTLFLTRQPSPEKLQAPSQSIDNRGATHPWGHSSHSTALRSPRELGPSHMLPYTVAYRQEGRSCNPAGLLLEPSDTSYFTPMRQSSRPRPDNRPLYHSAVSGAAMADASCGPEVSMFGFGMLDESIQVSPPMNFTCGTQTEQSRLEKIDCGTQTYDVEFPDYSGSKVHEVGCGPAIEPSQQSMFLTDARNLSRGEGCNWLQISEGGYINNSRPEYDQELFASEACTNYHENTLTPQPICSPLKFISPTTPPITRGLQRDSFQHYGDSFCQVPLASERPGLRISPTPAQPYSRHHQRQERRHHAVRTETQTPTPPTTARPDLQMSPLPAQSYCSSCDHQQAHYRNGRIETPAPTPQTTARQRYSFKGKPMIVPVSGTTSPILTHPPLDVYRHHTAERNGQAYSVLAPHAPDQSGNPYHGNTRRPGPQVAHKLLQHGGSPSIPSPYDYYEQRQPLQVSHPKLAIVPVSAANPMSPQIDDIVTTTDSPSRTTPTGSQRRGSLQQASEATGLPSPARRLDSPPALLPRPLIGHNRTKPQSGVFVPAADRSAGQVRRKSLFGSMGINPAEIDIPDPEPTAPI